MTYTIKQIIYHLFFEIKLVYLRRVPQALILNSFKELSLSAISTIERDNMRGKYWNNFNSNNNIKTKYYGNFLQQGAESEP
jgi:hypothetical protein